MAINKQVFVIVFNYAGGSRVYSARYRENSVGSCGPMFRPRPRAGARAVRALCGADIATEQWCAAIALASILVLAICPHPSTVGAWLLSTWHSSRANQIATMTAICHRVRTVMSLQKPQRLRHPREELLPVVRVPGRQTLAVPLVDEHSQCC